MFLFFVGVVSSEYLPTAHFVKDVDKLFNSFNSVKRGAAGKPLNSPLSDISPHVWLEIKWHYFQLASALFRFELQQVILAIVYM